ncbi:hypothetical protein LAZ67_15003276 [Cordylochernes scorpioides]|uniref:HTH CENPB-type domain-containing protein n=1 Tax=Cordylochernes scorpioides TaxID=51811 RepID=A0ABY6LA53_9ARAC|nr:hypothetical protein LAZ67_15003276 [Cordylochernes scorpioides]
MRLLPQGLRALQNDFEKHPIKTQNNIPVSGALVKEKAKEISVSLGVENFKCRDGWLWRFQRRNTIASLVVSGEINKVSEETVTDWLTKFEEIKNEYKDEDIFNIDETGVFYNLLPDRALDFKGTKCHGTLKSKERLMVVLCSNATGSEISKLWIIGKYKNPRCLNIINRLILPFDYTHQKSAWVDAYSFILGLIKFQRKMAAENRHVLLTMDNCSAHDTKDLDLPNVRIVYFPANCTSRIQPLDQGIIAAFKCHFESRLVKNALLGIESEQTTVKWNILQAMRAMAASWDSVSSQTIKNCFKKAWPTVEGKTADSFSLPETMLDEPEEWTKLLSATNPAETLTFLEYVALDEGLEICGSPELEEKKKKQKTMR